MQIDSKLPNVGLTIFTVMSKMAQEYNAINLSQGFPDFPVAEELVDGIHHYMKQGMNQYAPMPGMPQLRQEISKKLERTYSKPFDAETEITVTAGAIEALNSTITALVRTGEEVIIIDPAYDAYAPIIEMNGAIPVSVPLKSEDFSLDWEVIRGKVSDRTRMILLNSPHNPTGSVISEDDLRQLEDVVRGTDILVLSDEVYEHIIFDGHVHQSVHWSDELKKRSIVTNSFGKTFHATGWRIGYMVAQPELMKEIRKVHQYNAFCAHTPTQLAIADYLKDPNNYESLPELYQPKRDLFLELTKSSRFKPIPCSGTYFQVLSYDGISDKGDIEMAEWMTKEHGLAAIPMSVFYDDKRDLKMLRFCFAKGEETLKAAADVLCAI